MLGMSDEYVIIISDDENDDDEENDVELDDPISQYLS